MSETGVCQKRVKALYRAEQCHQERNAEIDHKPVEDGNHYKLLSGCPCDDGQCGVHRRGSSGRDGGKVSEPSYQQRGGQQCQNLPADIGKQGDGAQLGSLVFGNEDTGERVLAESRAYG